MAKLLIESCRNGQERNELINSGNKQSFTPLHAACLAGNTELVELLLLYGADLMKYDNRKFLPFHYAVVKDHT
jgi:ankyrin repeat protein